MLCGSVGVLSCMKYVNPLLSVLDKFVALWTAEVCSFSQVFAEADPNVPHV